MLAFSASPNVVGSQIRPPDADLRYVRNGTARLALWDTGPSTNIPILFIHGSWDDHRSWDGLVSSLPDRRVVRYDRRGHSLSSAPPGQGRIGEDVDDALVLLEALAIPRAHVIGHSYGGIVAIGLTARSPDRVASLIVHEPPLFGLLAKGDAEDLRLLDEAQTTMKRAAALLAQGDTEAGARLFMEQVAFGPGAWTRLFDAERRRTLLANAGTWLDQSRDPDRLAVDPAGLAGFPRRITVTTGRTSLPVYPATIRHLMARLPGAHLARVSGGHGAPFSDPIDYVRAIRAHLAAA